MFLLKMFLATTWKGNFVNLWSTVDYELMYCWNAQCNPCCLCFSQDSKILACAGFTNTGKRLCVAWDVETKQQIMLVTVHARSFRSISFNSTASQLLFSGWDTLSLLEVSSGSIVWIMHVSSNLSWIEAYFTVSELIVAASSDQLHAWNVTTGCEVECIKIPVSDSFFLMALSGDGSRIALGSSQGNIFVHSAINSDGFKNAVLLEPTRVDNHLCGLSFSFRGLVASSGDGFIQIWDVDAQLVLLEISGRFRLERKQFIISQTMDHIVIIKSPDSLQVVDFVSGNVVRKMDGHLPCAFYASQTILL